MRPVFRGKKRDSVVEILTVLTLSSEVEVEAGEVGSCVEGVCLVDEHLFDCIVAVDDDGGAATELQGINGAVLFFQFREALVGTVAVVPEVEKVADEGEWSRAGWWCRLSDLQVVTARRGCCQGSLEILLLLLLSSSAGRLLHGDGHEDHHHYDECSGSQNEDHLCEQF